jgi:hypothetical protein
MATTASSRRRFFSVVMMFPKIQSAKPSGQMPPGSGIYRIDVLSLYRKKKRRQ